MLHLVYSRSFSSVVDPPNRWTVAPVVWPQELAFPRWRPRTTAPGARVVLLGSWVATAASVAFYALGQLSRPLASGDAARAAAGVTVLGAAAILFARLQLQLVRDEADQREAWVLLGLGLLPLAWANPNPALAFGLAAALVRLDARWAVAAMAGVGVAFIGLYRDGGGLTQVSAPAALLELVVIGIAFAVLTRLAVTLDGLQRARERLARDRVDRERERVARDLHDLMGRTLVTASLRCQTLLRTTGDRPPQVRAKLERLQEILSTGQERVRAVTSVPITSSWEDELQMSRALCAVIGISFQLRQERELPVEHLQLAAPVLREVVTKALSHRRTGQIELSLQSGEDDASVIRIGYDGPSAPIEPVEVPVRVVAAVERAGGKIAASTAGGRRTLEVCLPAVVSARSP